MNDERIEERIQTEEISLAHNSDFAVVRKHHRSEEAKEETLRAKNYLRNAEDAVEQNDNSIDGVINNLPEGAEGTASGYVEAQKEEERKSLREEIRRQAEIQSQPTPRPTPRVLYTDGEERVL